MNLRCTLLCLIAPFVAASAELPPAQHHFTVIAHRGNHTRAHENTLTALQAAIAAGVDYAEVDLRRTADGQYILMHDARVDRMTDGHGLVKELTLAQIQSLQVRDLKRPELRADRVPIFGEVLKLVKGRLNLYLDFKEGDRAEVAALIRQAGVSRQVLVYDGVEHVAEWHRVAPELPCIVSPPGNAKTPQQISEFITRHKLEVLDGDWDEYSRELLIAANEAGAKVWPDIQTSSESPAYFEKVLSRGFTGVQTDHPEELISWLKERGLR